MRITLNGTEEIFPDGLMISGLIERVKEGDPHLIVEQNGKYVHARNYDIQVIMENDVIELINPNLGG